MPGKVIAWALIPLGGGGIGGDIAAVLPGLKPGILLFFLVLAWTAYMSGSHHLISHLIRLAGIAVATLPPG